MLVAIPDNLEASMQHKVVNISNERDASLGALHCFSVLAEKAMKSRELEDRLKEVERENETLKKAWNDIKKKNHLLIFENSNLQKKVVDGHDEMVKFKADVHVQMRALQSSNQSLLNEKTQLKETVEKLSNTLKEKDSHHAAEVKSLTVEAEKLKSGEILTDKAYKVACDKLFQSEAWEEANEEIMILTGRSLRDEIKEKYPDLDLDFLADRIDIPLPSEKRAQSQQPSEPPSPLPTIPEADSELEKDTTPKDTTTTTKDPVDVVIEKVLGEVSTDLQGEAAKDKGKEKTTAAARVEEGEQASASEAGIYGGCTSIEKL